jgi:hypothetical protein
METARQTPVATLERLGERCIRRVLWTTRGYDFNITREETLFEKIDYCHKNPVTRSLVATADQWQWSSFRFYEMDDRSLLPMDWDGRWPVIW